MLAASTAPRTLTQTKITTLNHILKVSKPESAVLMAYEVGNDKTTLLGHVSLRCEIRVNAVFTPRFKHSTSTQGPNTM